MIGDDPYEQRRLQVSVQVLGLSVRPTNCLRRAGIETVEQLVSRTPDELMALPNFGQTSLDEIRQVLEQRGLQLARISGVMPESVTWGTGLAPTAGGPLGAVEQRRDLTDALVDLAGWGLANTDASTVGDLLDELASRPGWADDATVPGSVRRYLLGTELVDIARSEEDRKDWRQRLVDLVDESRTEPVLAALLDGRLAPPPDGPIRSLTDLGDRYGVTREAIRRRELRFAETLMGALREQVVADRVDRLLDEIGSAVPRAVLEAGDLDLEGSVDRLLLFLAGRRIDADAKVKHPPYRQVVVGGEEWIVGPDGLPDDLVTAAFDQLARGRSCGWHGLVDAVSVRLGSAIEGDADLGGLLLGGDRSEIAGRLVRSCGAVHRYRDRAVDWRGSYEDKAYAILGAVGEPMDRDDLANAVNPDGPRGVINRFQSDERVRRVGTRTYALAAWGGEEYGDIVRHMQEVLDARGGSTTIEGLAAELDERFDINRASVVIHCTTNPAFVSDGTTVRRRRDGEAIEVRPLGEEYGVIRIGEGALEGCWSYRLEVDHNYLRGSGHRLPRSIAMEMGMTPGDTGSFQSDHGTVNWGWTQTNGSLGSIREILLGMGAVEGDLVFVAATGPGRIGFVHEADQGECGVAERAQILMQADVVQSWPVTRVAYSVGIEWPYDYEDYDVLFRRLEDRWRRHPDTEEEAVLRQLDWSRF